MSFGCFGGEFSRAIRRGDIEGAEACRTRASDIFGKENYYLEIMHHPGVENIEEVRKEIIRLGKKLDIPLVATQDSHYYTRTIRTLTKHFLLFKPTAT